MTLFRILVSFVYFNFIQLAFCEMANDGRTQIAKSDGSTYHGFVEMVNNLTMLSENIAQHKKINVSFDMFKIFNNQKANLNGSIEESVEGKIQMFGQNSTLNDKEMNDVGKEAKIKFIFPKSSFKEKLNVNISKPELISRVPLLEKPIIDNTNFTSEETTTPLETLGEVSVAITRKGHPQVQTTRRLSIARPLVKPIKPFRQSQVIRSTSDQKTEQLSYLEQTVANEIVKSFNVLMKNDTKLQTGNSVDHNKTVKSQPSQRKRYFRRKIVRRPINSLTKPLSVHGQRKDHHTFARFEEKLKTERTRLKISDKTNNTHNTDNFKSENNKRRSVEGNGFKPPSRAEVGFSPMSSLPIIGPIPSRFYGQKSEHITYDGINASDLQQPTPGQHVFDIDPPAKEVLFNAGIISPEFLNFVKQKYNELLAQYNKTLTNYKVYNELYNKAKQMGTI